MDGIIKLHYGKTWTQALKVIADIQFSGSLPRSERKPVELAAPTDRRQPGSAADRRTNHTHVPSFVRLQRVFCAHQHLRVPVEWDVDGKLVRRRSLRVGRVNV